MCFLLPIQHYSEKKNLHKHAHMHKQTHAAIYAKVLHNNPKFGNLNWKLSYTSSPLKSSDHCK